MRRRREEMAVCKPRRPQEEPALQTPWHWTSSLTQELQTQQEPEKLFRRPPEARLKESSPCTHPNPYQQTHPWTIAIKLLTKSSWVGTHSFEKHEPTVPPLCLWQSNKGFLFYFTQNSVFFSPPSPAFSCPKRASHTFLFQLFHVLSHSLGFIYSRNLSLAPLLPHHSTSQAVLQLSLFCCISQSSPISEAWTQSDCYKN